MHFRVWSQAIVCTAAALGAAASTPEPTAPTDSSARLEHLVGHAGGLRADDVAARAIAPATQRLRAVHAAVLDRLASDRFERMLDRIERAHEDILRLHSEQMQSLTALSAEIAEKLRTPLSSIKGLTGLALQEIQDSRRAADRLEDLRSEAARMQKLLEEFLNFSRPLSPLSLDTVDGVRIGGEIIDLFQGVAQERHLSIALSGSQIDLSLLPHQVSVGAAPVEMAGAPAQAGLKERVDAYERGLIVAALEQASGNRTQAARVLGLNRGTLHSKLHKYGLAAADEGDEQASPEG